MTGEIPAFLKRYDKNSPEAQRVHWTLNNQWKQFLAGRDDIASNLLSENQNHGGIRRSYLKRLATGDPEEFFLSVMAWGFGDFHVHYPAQVSMMTPPFEVEKIAAIMSVVKEEGAAMGWQAMIKDYKVAGLGYGFGTKILYFAGYENVNKGPLPLILDSKVSKGLSKIPNFDWSAEYDFPNKTNYLRYLELAANWAESDLWSGSPEAVEYALFMGTR